MPTIPYAQVHTTCSAIADSGSSFESIATRLVKDQRPLLRFLRNATFLHPDESEVVLFLSTSCLRVFDQAGGRMPRIRESDLDAASKRVTAAAPCLLPLDAHLPTRLRGIEIRAQPHLLEEVLTSLYGPRVYREGERQFPPERAGLLFLTTWTAVEAMDSCWKPPSSANY